MLKITDYYERLEVVGIQFRFVRFAIAELPKSKRQRFFDSLRSEEIARTEQGFERLKSLQTGELSDFELVRELVLKNVEQQVRKKFSRKNQRFYDEFIEDGLNASELLIRVAHFEAFMKDIHLEVLRAKPSLLGTIRPARQVKFEDVFREGGTLADIQTQEFIKEVKEVDGKRVKERADYFEKHLLLRWCDATTLEFLKEILDVRNEISHQNPSRPVKKEDLEKATDILRKIPGTCVSQAEKIYKGHFK